jgi:hypothetical protein
MEGCYKDETASMKCHLSVGVDENCVYIEVNRHQHRVRLTVTQWLRFLELIPDVDKALKTLESASWVLGMSLNKRLTVSSGYVYMQNDSHWVYMTPVEWTTLKEAVASVVDEIARLLIAGYDVGLLKYRIVKKLIANMQN